MRFSTFLLALFTMMAFAANSILCRQALMTGSIGPVEFTAIRLGSGIIGLAILVAVLQRLFRSTLAEPAADLTATRFRFSHFRPALALFSYAIFFSLAYVQLNAGAGALIRFAAVQTTMMGWSIIRGNRVTLVEWAGLAVSFAGLVYLLLPGLSAPPAAGTVMMILAGVSWGIYSLLGQKQGRPIIATARNFLFSLPGVLILGLVSITRSSRPGTVALTREGISLAVISGAVASGMGYVLWYLTVRRITTTIASVSQLVVPVLAAVGGIVFLGEQLTLRLTIASVLIIGGIVMTVMNRKIAAMTSPRVTADTGSPQV